jgi:7-cyano-7-deazaguanine synthase in queuosine biosynthesis
MQKFIALYLCPVTTLNDWMQKPEAERKPIEEKMMHEWQAWAQAHAAMILETNGAGKASRITPDGVAPHRNEVMMFSIVQADSQEAAEKIFIGHPHLGIPTASIELMPIKPMSA